ncbi:MAG: ATP-binding cassette domain-containing protein [Flavobacteriales bacterium]|nr:ATP-binding cassette domain-containing protein [Flavobacteriales bacterium]
MIDAKDPTNALLLSPSFNSEGCYGLFDIIRSGLMNEVSIVAYDPGPKGEDDHFEKPFGQGEVRVLLSSTVVGQGPQVTRYMLKEDWIFDKQRGVMEVRIIGLAPMIEILGEDGEVRGHQPLFWLYYPECRLLLSRWLAFVEMQDDVRKSYEAVFAQRRFTSSIVKVSNGMVRGIDTYRTGLDALLESEGVREQFLQAGFDLWNYSSWSIEVLFESERAELGSLLIRNIHRRRARSHRISVRMNTTPSFSTRYPYFCGLFSSSSAFVTITVQGLTLHFGQRPMFDDISFFIGSDDRIGLVGRNGAGKSTLLKIMAGQQSYDKGTIGKPKELTMGYLPQEMAHNLTITPWQVAEKAFEEALELNASLERIEKDLEKATTDEEAIELATLLAHAHERLNAIGAADHDQQIEKMLKGIGFVEADMHRLMSELSGGWRMRAELARLLLMQPDLLLLDEPTNHLDLPAIQWLEDLLRSYPAALVLISHDKTFLDRLTKRTIEVLGGS